MQLDIRAAAKSLGLPEDAVCRRVQTGEIPAQKVHGQYRINRTELLEWAVSHQMDVSSAVLQVSENSGPVQVLTLSEALKAGGIHYNLPGDDKSAVLHAMVDVLRLPESVDRELLFQMYLARESLASTGLGEGIAIPHVRNPVVLHLPAPQITLCFLATPVDFQALDGKAVHALFSLITPTIRTHLALLSQLAFALKDEKLREAIRGRVPAEQILAEIVRTEAGFQQTAGGIGGETRP